MAEAFAERLARFGRLTWPHIADAAERPASAGAGELIPVWTIRATVALATVSVLVSLMAALTRGPWIDEFWTLYAIDPDLSLGAAFRERWVTDVHPPLFYFVSRLLSPALGDNMAVLRLQNVIAMVGLIAFFIYAAAAWKSMRSFLLVCAVLTFSSYFATGYFAEYRSYYAQFVFGICFYVCAYALLRGDVLVVTRQRRVTTAIFAAAAILLVNLHFVTALLTATSLTGLIVFALFVRDLRLAVLMCVVGLLAVAPLIAILPLQAHYLFGRAGGHFWIDTGMLASLTILAASIAKGVGFNLVACAIACWALMGRPVTAIHHGEHGATKDRMIGATFLLCAALSIGALLLINPYTPIIIDRYLVLCSAAIICGVSILAKDAIFSSRAGFALVLANAALFLGIAGNKLVWEPRWNATASLIAKEVATCPSTLVEAFPFPYPGALPGEGKVFALAYTYLAHGFGFRVRMAQAGEAIGQTSANTCPTILWTEHVPWFEQRADVPDAFVLDAAQQSLGPINFAGALVKRTKTGALIVFKPRVGG